MSKPTLTARLESLLFGHRRLVIGLFVLATMGFVWSATGLRIDAGFAKQLPLEHPYMATFVKHQQEFGGANRLLVAIVARDGNMFTPGFFDALKGATDEVFFLPGVDRARVQSLFTPNVRYTEVVEDGIAAGNVIPDDFATTPEGLEAVRRNILKAGIVGRLVANDFSGRHHLRGTAGVRSDDGAAPRLPGRGEGHRDARAGQVRRGRRARLGRGRAHHRVRQGDGRHGLRRPAGRAVLPRQLLPDRRPRVPVRPVAPAVVPGPDLRGRWRSSGSWA